MKIELTLQEQNIIRNYQVFLYNVRGNMLSVRDVLHIILEENSEELNIIQRDLRAELKIKTK